MINRYTFSLIHRTDLCKKSELKPIHFRVFINGQKVVLSTFIFVSVECWDQQQQRCIFQKGKIKMADVRQNNEALDAIQNRCYSVFLEFQTTGEFLDAKEFRFRIQSGTPRTDFIAFLDAEAKTYAESVEYNTMKHVKRAITLFKEFGKNVYMRDLTIDFIRKFEGFLRRKNLATNSRAKIHRDMKIFVTRACQKFGLKNPYHLFKIETAETDIVFLTTPEVRRLMAVLELKDITKAMKIALQKFLFACHCGGQRISDIHSIGAKKLIDGKLVFVPQKTKRKNKTVKIPFKDEYYKWVQYPEGEKFWDVTTDQHINKQLRAVRKLADIQKSMSFKTARHTFATGYLAGGGTVPVLQQILRHSKIETTMIYVHITDQRIIEESGKVDMFSIKEEE